MKHEDIKKFVEFAFNYDSSLTWIDEINWTCDAKHIKNKFIQARYSIGGIYGAMPLFFSMLDEQNQQALIEYINTLYMKPLKSMENMMITINEIEYTGYIVLGYNNKTSERRFFTSDAFTYRGTESVNYYSSIKNIPLINEREQADKLKAKLYRLYPRKKYGFTFSVMLNKKDVYYEAY